FMDNLTNYLNLPESGKILDLACGKGRHSVYLNSLGYDVTGVDLSPKSIAYAKQFENDTLHFEVHDMCKPYNGQFDAVCNLFTNNLTNYLNLPESGKILDLACGKGRHSVYLNSLGYDVTGVDLSPKSIAYAKQFENDTLHFEVHDMCKPYNGQFDAVFNLFTSFGYFDKEDDNLNTIKAIKADLNETGFGVIDFMNVEYVIGNLVPEDVKSIHNIDFHQKRYVKDG